MSDSTLNRKDTARNRDLLIRDDLAQRLERFAIRPGFRFWIFAATLLVMGLYADTMVQSWITQEQADWNKNQSRFWIAAKQPGEWWVLAVACLLIGRLHVWRWRGSAVLILGAVFAGIITWFMKWCAGRIRPRVEGSEPFAFDPGINGLYGLFHQVNLSFPSGHATMAFALAAGLTFLAPRAWWVWAAMASMTAAERVAEKAHWPSDVVTGMIVGVLGFRIALWCCLAATHPPLRESLRRSDHASPKT